MSDWAAIESGSSPVSSAGRAEAAAGSRGRLDPVHPNAAHRDAFSRVHRQQRPIIGSLDGAGALIQRHARELIAGSALVLLPSVAVNLAATTLAFDRYRDFHGSTVSIPELFGADNSTSSLEDLLWYVGLGISNLVACLTGGFVATLVVRRQLGLPMRAGPGYRALISRLPALTAAWLIGHCWVIPVGLLLARVSTEAIAPIILLGGPVVMVLSTMTLCAAPAIVIERLGPVAGLRRAWRLAAANFGILFGFVAASIVIGVLVQYGIAYLPRLMEAIGLLTFGRFGWLIEGAAGQLGRLVSTPLIAAATVLVYLEVRMTTEGMDIVLDADRAFGARS